APIPPALVQRPPLAYSLSRAWHAAPPACPSAVSGPPRAIQFACPPDRPRLDRTARALQRPSPTDAFSSSSGDPAPPAKPSPSVPPRPPSFPDPPPPVRSANAALRGPTAAAPAHPGKACATPQSRNPRSPPPRVPGTPPSGGSFAPPRRNPYLPPPPP